MELVLDHSGKLHASGYQRVGERDLGQICEHLTKSMDSSVDGLDAKAPFIIKIIVKLIGVYGFVL